MFRPPADYVWQHKVRIYEHKFNSKVPQWIQTLDISHSVKILSMAINCNWSLPEEVLTSGEPFSGFQSLWHDKKNKWDIQTKIRGEK